MDEIVQGSPEWLALRCGKVTASRMADLCARTRNGYGASRANYMAELISERLTGQPAERFTNAAMARGTEKEPDARAAYEFYSGATADLVGFVAHPSIADSGASPDGLIGADGLVEIKCPNTATHIETLLSQDIPDKYVKQMMWQMACTERVWCDWVSYDDRLPETMRLFVKRLPRDETVIQELEREARAFIRELEETVGRLRALYEPDGRPANIRAAADRYAKGLGEAIVTTGA